jgi:hypothetical protein
MQFITHTVLRKNHWRTILLTSCLGGGGLVLRLAVLRRGKFGNKTGLLNLLIFPFSHHGKASLYLQRQTTDKRGHKFMAPARLINYPRKKLRILQLSGVSLRGGLAHRKASIDTREHIHPRVKPTSLVEA